MTPCPDYPECTARCNGRNPCQHGRRDKAVEAEFRVMAVIVAARLWAETGSPAHEAQLFSAVRALD